MTGDPLAADVHTIWEQGIEGFWGNQITLSDGRNAYPLLVDVSFSTNIEDADYVLRVRNEFCRSFVGTISEWCTLPMTDLSGVPNLNMRDEVAIHEFGHMLGLYDEYVGGGVDPSVDPDDLCRTSTFLGFPVQRGSLCGSMMADFGPIQERYFDDIIAFYEGVSMRDLTLAFSPVFGTYPLTDPGPYFVGILESSAVPEPGTLALVALAMSGLLAVRRRRQ